MPSLYIRFTNAWMTYVANQTVAVDHADSLYALMNVVEDPKRKGE